MPVYVDIDDVRKNMLLDCNSCQEKRLHELHCRFPQETTLDMPYVLFEYDCKVCGDTRSVRVLKPTIDERVISYG